MKANKVSIEASDTLSEAHTNLQAPDKQGMPSRGSPHLTPNGINKIDNKGHRPGNPGQVAMDRVMKLARLTGSAQYYTPQDPLEGLEWLPDSPDSPEPPNNQTIPDPVSRGASTQPVTPPTPTALPKFSENSITQVKNQGLTQMEHYVGRNLEDRGGLGRVKEVAKNYVESLDDIVTDRPPSCHEPDVPGQGTKQRDQLLKADQRPDPYMKEINHKMISASVDTCNSCNHDLPPEDVEYAEMEDTPFSSYQDVTIHPGYQETLVISAVHTPSRRTGTHGTRPRTTTSIASHAPRHWQHDKQIQQCRLEEGRVNVKAATDEGWPIRGLQHQGRIQSSSRREKPWANVHSSTKIR